MPVFPSPGLRQMRMTGTTDGDGNATVYGSERIFGWLYAVQWIDGDLADGVGGTLTVVNEDGDYTLLTLTAANADAWHYARLQASDNAGAAVAGVYDYPLINGTPKLVIASGGDTATGGLVLYYFLE